MRRRIWREPEMQKDGACAEPSSCCEESLYFSILNLPPRVTLTMAFCLAS